MRCGNLSAVLSAALLLAAGPAAAERAAVVRWGGDAGIAEASRRQAVAKLSQLLRSQGLDLMPAAEAARRVAAVGCQESECGAQLRAALGVDLLVTVGLWAAGDGREVRSVVVGLVRDAGYVGTADVGDAGLTVALEEAVAMARSRQALGPGPWLRVEGEPRGAMILLDGAEWGLVPHEAAVRAGDHSVTVRLAGFVTEERTVQLRDGASAPVLVRVRLARAEPARAATEPRAGPRTAPPAARRRIVVDRPVAGPLLVGGAGLVLAGIALGGLVTTDCVVEDGGRCREGTVANGTWVAVYGVAGAVAIGAAVAWHMFGGRRREVSVGVGLGPGSLYLRGEF
jgi:hypothetical protein